MNESSALFALLSGLDPALATDEVMFAFHWAANAHRGQQRRFSEEPYIFHPVRVAMLVSRQPGATASHVAAALLHDTLEDTDVTEAELRESWGKSGWGGEAIDVVVALTKNPNGTQTYLEFIESLSSSPAAQVVKRCDVIDNLSTIPAGDRLVPRYLMALSVLLGVD